MRIKASTLLVGLLTALSLFLISCSKANRSSAFSSGGFKDGPGAATLCFDLRNDSEPMSGLVLKVSPTVPSAAHTVALPFESTSASSRREIYSSWGSYEATTLIGFHTSQNVSGVYDVGIAPVFGPTPSQWADDPNDLVGGSVFFLRYGLTRHFIFKFPDADRDRIRWQQALSAIRDTEVDSIAVALPAYVSGREIKRTNQTSIPPPMLESSGVKFYPATSIAAGGRETIYLKYEIPPNRAQDIFVEQTIKTVVAFIAPLIQVLILWFRKPEKRRRAKILIWVAASIQVVIILLLGYLAFSSWQESTFKALNDLLVAISTALISAYVLWQEKKDPKAEQLNMTGKPA